MYTIRPPLAGGQPGKITITTVGQTDTTIDLCRQGGGGDEEELDCLIRGREREGVAGVRGGGREGGGGKGIYIPQASHDHERVPICYQLAVRGGKGNVYSANQASFTVIRLGAAGSLCNTVNR